MLSLQFSSQFLSLGFVELLRYTGLQFSSQLESLSAITSSSVFLSPLCPHPGHRRLESVPRLTAPSAFLCCLIFDPLYFSMNFKISLSVSAKQRNKISRDFDDRGCTEYVDQFGEYYSHSNTKSSIHEHGVSFHLFFFSFFQLFYCFYSFHCRSLTHFLLNIFQDISFYLMLL